MRHDVLHLDYLQRIQIKQRALIEFAFRIVSLYEHVIRYKLCTFKFNYLFCKKGMSCLVKKLSVSIQAAMPSVRRHVGLCAILLKIA
jgi:hypothetical protein